MKVLMMIDFHLAFPMKTQVSMFFGGFINCFSDNSDHIEQNEQRLGTCNLKRIKQSKFQKTIKQLISTKTSNDQLKLKLHRDLPCS